jgi:acetyltransferase-like isoleucine patch superfamily enzyme
MTSELIEVVGRGEVKVGRKTAIAPGAQVIFTRPAVLTIGDYCTIGPGVKFVCDGGDISLGDWTTIHDRCLVMSTSGVAIGEHGWFGQQCVIDGTGGLTIGKGVRVGMYSQIWSHVAAGEQIEGCTLYGMRPVVLEDDTWLVGSCIVASGVTLGRRTVALIASNITKSWPSMSVLAGSPAAPKAGMSFYREVSLDEKWQMMQGWADDIGRRLSLSVEQNAASVILRNSNGEVVSFARSALEMRALMQQAPHATVCCIESKTYSKRMTDTEYRVLKALSSNRARFNSVSEACQS